jgi:branched-chain amino acid transport system permease protein
MMRARAPTSRLLDWHRVGAGEVIYWLLAIAAFFAFPKHLSFAASVLVGCIFSLSLDLALGFGGIVTLGHAMFFGIGAYAAGLVTHLHWHEPISTCLLAASCAALFALVTGPLILRLSGLPLIMATLALGMILFEAANSATWLTGGDDGLQNIDFDPVLGLFEWSVYGTTSYLYCLAWLFVCFAAARRLVGSPFGIAVQGIRENRGRMALIGTPVLGALVRLYVFSAFVAGIAGALLAETTNFVGLEVLHLDTSVDALVMLVLGGVGRLYGGLIGAPVYMVLRHFSAEWNPYHWMFVIGGFLVFAVRVAPGGISGLLDHVRAFRSRPSGSSA